MVRAMPSIAVIGLALSQPQALSAKIPDQRSAVQTIVTYESVIDARSAEPFINVIYKNVDKIVGLKLTVEKSGESKGRYFTSLSSNQLNVSSGDPMNGSTEIVINNGVGTTGAGAFYTVDGFYLIKSGGSHAAGAVSFGAILVDEATIRLNPHIRLITKSF